MLSDGIAITDGGSGDEGSGEVDLGSGGSGEEDDLNTLTPWLQEEGGSGSEGEDDKALKDDFLFLTNAFRLDTP